jgi:tetratricopeptide (TPR) repeat protein
MGCYYSRNKESSVFCRCHNLQPEFLISGKLLTINSFDIFFEDTFRKIEIIAKLLAKTLRWKVTMKRYLILITIPILFSVLFCASFQHASSESKEYYEHGNAKLAIKDWEGAIADYNKALEFDPANDEMFFKRGLAKFKRTDYQGALADHTKALEVNPKNALAYSSRGNTKIKISDFDGAIADCTKALEINPLQVEAYLVRGFANICNGNIINAISDTSKVIEFSPENPEAYFNRGLAYYENDDLENAIADFSKAIELDAEYAYAYYYRGLAKEKKSLFGDALSDFDKAITINPQDADIYNNKAWLLATCTEDKFRDGVKAIEAAKTAIIIDNDVEYQDTLAAAYAEAGKIEEAIELQKEVLERAKKESLGKEKIEEFSRHLESYKAGKPWRE